jgi:uncharacterized protein YkwD
MRTRTLAAAVLTASLAIPAAAATAASPPAPRQSTTRSPHVTPRSDAWDTKVLELTNARRKAHGRKPLRANPCAEGFADRWTKHMASTRVLEHQSLDPFFNCPHTSWAGENIAEGYETPRALVSAWMHSAEHRANILSRHFNRIGISGWRATNGVTFATQDFLG